MVSVLDPDEVLAPGSVTNAAPDTAGGEPGPRSRFGNLTWLFSAAFAMGGLKVGLARLGDNSFFVHLTTGNWILDHGSVPHHDVYSYTAAGRPFLAQSWLAEALYSFLDRSALGGFGIRLMMGIVAAGIGAATFRLTLRLCRDRIRAAGITLVAFAVIAAMYSARPLGFGLLGLVGVLWIVEVPESRIGQRLSISLPIVMWLWGNVHGSMALGFGYIALHLIGRAADGALPRRGTREIQIVRAAAVSLVTLCVNPYGPSLVLFPVELLRKGSALKDVVEWMSPSFHTTAGISFAAWLIVALSVLTLGKRPLRRDIIVAVPFLIMALWALRNLGVATLVMVPIVARSAAKDTEPSDDPTRAIGRLIGCGIVALALLFAAQASAEASYDARSFSRDAYRYVAKNYGEGRRLFTTDANAGWMLAAHFPKQRVFMDDRYDMFPQAVIDDYTSVSRLRSGWQRILTHYRIEVIIWPTASPLSEALLLDTSQWKRAYRDKGWTVFVPAHPSS